MVQSLGLDLQLRVTRQWAPGIPLRGTEANEASIANRVIADHHGPSVQKQTGFRSSGLGFRESRPPKEKRIRFKSPPPTSTHPLH